MERSNIVVFTDGAAKGNPGPGGWAAIIITPEGEVTELGGGSPYTTNNKMEISGALGALEHLKRTPGRVEIRTDSKYLIDGITKWIHGWRRKGWKTSTGGDVLNRDLWESLSALVAERGKDNPIVWQYVRGHTGVVGNERADEIAVAFSNDRREPLYRGPLIRYGVPILDAPLPDAGEAAPSRRSSTPSRSNAKAFSYLSLLGGKPERHATWPECERRVKGQPGARFKKAMSREDEGAILRSWGLRGDEL